MAIIIDWRGPTIDCDGRFTEIANVRNTAGPARDHIVSVTARSGISDISSQPQTLPNLGTAFATVTVSGRLTAPCTAGSLVINIGGHMEGKTVDPNSVRAKLNGAPPKADTNGEFSYTLAVVCCPPPGGGPAAATWDLTHQSTPEIASSSAAPARVVCPPAGPHMVLVTGKLTDRSVQGVDVYKLSQTNQLVCSAKTTVAPYVPPTLLDGCLALVFRPFTKRRQEREPERRAVEGFRRLWPR